MGGGGGMLESLSVSSSVHVSPEPLNHFFFFNQTWYGGALYEAMFHAETLVHYLQYGGHNKGLNKQNMIIFTAF